MYEQQLKNSVVTLLRIGAIQPFQIEETLHNRGVSNFDIIRLKSEIEEQFEKEHPCY